MEYIWKINYGAIERYELVKETDHFLTYRKKRLSLWGKNLNEMIEVREKKSHNFFRTYKDARQSVIRRIENRIEAAKSALQAAEAELARANELPADWEDSSPQPSLTQPQTNRHTGG